MAGENIVMSKKCESARLFDRHYKPGLTQERQYLASRNKCWPLHIEGMDNRQPTGYCSASKVKANPCFENRSFQPFWIPARGREKGTWINQYQAQGYGCDKLEETLYAQTFSALFLVKRRANDSNVLRSVIEP